MNPNTNETEKNKRSQYLKSRENCNYCCNKLATYDWLSEIEYFEKTPVPEFVEVRFKNTRKLFCRNINKLVLKIGDIVVIETPTGHDIGIVSLVSILVIKQMKKRNISTNSPNILNIVRIASLKDIERWEDYKRKEYDTMIESRKIAAELNIQMKINDVEIQGDGKKTTFYYTADARIDFRELIKRYAKAFKNKIEMRQIGIRQESGRVGGLADCGKELCCSVWLTEFTSVPTVAAKQQNLYLNPSKLSGQCGRLKCCLNYELDNYLEAFEKFPAEDIVLHTQRGNAKVMKLDILKGIMWFCYDNENNLHPIPIHISKVFEIIDMNKRNIKPNDLSAFEEIFPNKETSYGLHQEELYEK